MCSTMRALRSLSFLANVNIAFRKVCACSRRAAVKILRGRPQYEGAHDSACDKLLSAAKFTSGRTSLADKRWSNVVFFVTRSSDFQSDFVLATPIDLHLHMAELGLGLPRA